MPNDIAPELREKLLKAFHENLANDAKLNKLMQDITYGNIQAQSAAAAQASERIGEAASRALQDVITPDALPNGQMYYNIAQRTLVPELREVHAQIGELCEEAFNIANERAGVGINAVRAPFPEDRVKGIVDRLCEQPLKEVEWMLKEPIVNVSQSMHNDMVEVNARAQRKAGLRPKLIRRVVGHCCDWCEALAGEYDYGDQPDDFFRMHENCRCTVIFQPAKGDRRGRYQDVYSKRWYGNDDELAQERADRLTAGKREVRQKKAKLDEAAKTRKERARLTEDQRMKLDMEIAAERKAAVTRAGGEDALKLWQEEQRKLREAAISQLLR